MVHWSWAIGFQNASCLEPACGCAFPKHGGHTALSLSETYHFSIWLFFSSPWFISSRLHACSNQQTMGERQSTVGKCSNVGTHDECAMTDSRAPQPASAVTWPPTMGKRGGTATLVRPASAAVEPPTSGIVLQQARMTVWPPMVSAAKSGGGVITSCSGVHIHVE